MLGKKNPIGFYKMGFPGKTSLISIFFVLGVDKIKKFIIS